jgi:hypothetical protein
LSPVTEVWLPVTEVWLPVTEVWLPVTEVRISPNSPSQFAAMGARLEVDRPQARRSGG